MRFQVEVTESSGAVYEVEALSHDEAEAVVEALWRRGNTPINSYMNLDVVAVRISDEK